MAGATAATAAGVTASHANTVTINLVDNYISTSGGNHLNADLTGDGHPDLTIANVYLFSGFYVNGNAGVSLNGVRASFGNESSGYPRVLVAGMRLGSRTAHYYHRYATPYRSSVVTGTPSLTGSIPVFFKDLHINGGAPTRGSLEVTVGPISPHGGIQLDSLTYNTPTPGSRLASVPDGGSSLALLAMGAGGILAFRRWRATQQSC